MPRPILELFSFDKLQALLAADVGKLSKVVHNAHILPVETHAHVEDNEDEDEQDEKDNPKLPPAFALVRIFAHDGLKSSCAVNHLRWKTERLFPKRIASKVRAI